MKHIAFITPEYEVSKYVNLLPVMACVGLY